MPPKLEIYNNNEPLDIHPIDLAKADSILRKIGESTSFFRVRLQEQPKMTDVHTHMGLLESYLTDLIPLVKYDSVLEEEREKRYAEIKAANTEIHRLEKLVGNGISPEGVSSKLREYDDGIRLWYGAHGFQYASLKQYTPYGIIYEFNDDLQYDPDNGCSSRKEWEKYFFEKFSILATKESAYDIYYDSYHGELLDTDNNKELIHKLLKENFPNHSIHEFHSRKNDFGSFSLRFTVNIPYVDIDNMLKTIVPEYK